MTENSMTNNNGNSIWNTQQPHAAPHAVPHVVIIGGGFGGLYAAKALGSAPVRVTLIDRRNFHLFQPLLYQVATAGLSPGNIAAPLRFILRRHKNIRVWLGEVTDIDPPARRIALQDGTTLDYDYLILATGSSHSYFGNDQWEDFAPGLKTLEDALDIRARVLSAYEEAERETDPDRRKAWLTFVVVGGGPTGVELAGALAEMARFTLRPDFRAIDPAETTVLLVEALDRILPPYTPELSAKAKASLENLGVTVRTSSMVVGMDEDSVTLRPAGRKDDEADETVRAHTVLWAAGVRASPLGRILHERGGIELDRVGRVVVGPDFGVPGYDNLFVVGDLASYTHGLDKPLPGIAPVAMQAGRYVAKVIRHRVINEQRAAGEARPEPFRYRDRGNMATIGRAAAVAQLGRVSLSGFIAWLTWLFVHLLYLAGFDNRVLVGTQWFWNYLTYRRSVRLIVGESYVPEPSEEKHPA